MKRTENRNLHSGEFPYPQQKIIIVQPWVNKFYLALLEVTFVVVVDFVVVVVVVLFVVTSHIISSCSWGQCLYEATIGYS